MSFSDVRTAQIGDIEACLTIEGIQWGISTTQRTWPLTGGFPTDLTVRNGMLRKAGLAWGVTVDPKHGDMKQPGITFQIVDAMDSSGNLHRATEMLASKEIAARTELTATLPQGATVSATVGSTAAFAASGTFWTELEAISYTGKTATTFTTLTRAKYGSRDIEHTFRDDSGAEIREIPLKPRIYDRPVSWYGRRVKLWIAEVQADGNLSTPELVYIGRVNGSINLAARGAGFEVPTDSIWSVIDTQLNQRERLGKVQGLNFLGDHTTSWVIVDSGGAITASGSFSSSGTYDDAGDFFTFFWEGFNTSLGAGRTIRYVGEVHFGIGSHHLPIPSKIVAEGIGASGRLSFSTTNGVAAVLGIRPSLETGPATAGGIGEILSPGAPPVEYQGAFFGGAAIFIDNTAEYRVQLSDVTPFSAFNISGSGYHIQSCVDVGGIIYPLESKDTGANQLILGNQITAGPLVMYSTREAGGIPVRQGFMMDGDFLACWKAFIDNSLASIPLDVMGYLDTNDFDWTTMQREWRPSDSGRRLRIVTEPQSFQKTFLEDLNFCSMLPSISGGKISAFALRQVNLAESALTVDHGVLKARNNFKWTLSRERIVNQTKYSNFGDEIFINDYLSQGEYGNAPTQPRELRLSGWVEMVPADLSEGLSVLASVYFDMFGYDNPVLECDCTIRAAGLVPGNVVKLTSEILPSTRTGARGITSESWWVMGVTISPFKDGGHVRLELIRIASNEKRSGFAPAARMTTFVDNGAPAGTKRYEIQVDADDYGTAQNNALYFLAGMKVELRQWDVAGAPTVESNTVSAAGSEVSGGIGRIYLTAAPVAAIPGTLSRITLDDYDTAAQTQSAKDYLHVADDVDDNIGTTTDRGFMPG